MRQCSAFRTPPPPLSHPESWCSTFSCLPPHTHTHTTHPLRESQRSTVSFLLPPRPSPHPSSALKICLSSSLIWFRVNPPSPSCPPSLCTQAYKLVPNVQSAQMSHCFIFFFVVTQSSDCQPPTPWVGTVPYPLPLPWAGTVPYPHHKWALAYPPTLPWVGTVPSHPAMSGHCTLPPPPPTLPWLGILP